MSVASRRIDRIRQALASAGLDAVVCARPANVLLLSGYWPVTGTAIALATASGRITVLAPQDEQSLAGKGWADEVHLFHPGSLDSLQSTAQAVRQPLLQMLHELAGSSSRHTRLGCEQGETSVPASYVGLHVYGQAVAEIAGQVAGIELGAADEILAQLRAVLVEEELAHVRMACTAAKAVFLAAPQFLKPGIGEAEAAAQLSTRYVAASPHLFDAGRAGAAVFCMSGPNGGQSYAAYQRSRMRRMVRGDLVLLHCNSHVNGYWTDITRTYCLGAPDARQERMFEAIFAARAAALAAIRPGATGAQVDQAARQVLADRGFGAQFKHPLGHGVGFAAIDHNALPRLHPVSQDVLREGMVFNIEPGIYFEDAGMRHCDMVTATAEGAEVLTPLQADIAERIIE